MISLIAIYAVIGLIYYVNEWCTVDMDSIPMTRWNHFWVFIGFLTMWPIILILDHQAKG